MLFGKKPSPYEPDQYMGDKSHPSSKAQEKPSSTSKSCGMPPFVKDGEVTEATSQAEDSVPKSLRELPVDAEHEAFLSWKQSNGKEQDKDVTHPSVKTNVPSQPGENVLQSAPQGRSVQGNGQNGSFYDYQLGPKGKTHGNGTAAKPYVWKPIAPKIPERDVIAFMVENSNDTFEHKESIVNIVSQTVEKKKDAIFLFVKVGNEQTPFTPMDYKAVKEGNVISSLITKSEDNELPNLASALFYLVNNLNVFASDTFSFDKLNYKLGSCSIVCIGTGSCIQNDNSTEIISSCISRLQKISKLKTFKYFCIKDTDAIRVSALGFPVIGHIISDFYG